MHAHTHTCTHTIEMILFTSCPKPWNWPSICRLPQSHKDTNKNSHCMIFKFNVHFYRLVKHAMIISHYLLLQIRWQDRLGNKVNYNSEVSKRRKGSGYDGRRSIGRRNRHNEKTGKGQLRQSGNLAGPQRHAAHLQTVQKL